jgi:zinc transport system permease protein
VVLGVFLAFVTALGIVLLSRAPFNRFQAYLIGDLFALSRADLPWISLVLGLCALFLGFAGNAMRLVALSPSLARSRGVSPFWVETAFTCLLAATVTISVNWVGILLINALLVLPGATSRLLAKGARGSLFLSLGLSVLSSYAGLIGSYYAGTQAGASIVLVGAGLYALCALAARLLRLRRGAR